MLLQRLLERLLRLLVKTILLHDARHELHLAEADRKVLEPCAQQALDGQCEHFGIRRRARTADELDPRLVKLALPPHLALLRTENAADIGELERQRRVLETACDHACDGRRHLVAQRERFPALVKELEKLRRKLSAAVHRERIEVFDGRRYHFIIAPKRKKRRELRLDGALACGLCRQEIACPVRNSQNLFFVDHVVLSYSL